MALSGTLEELAVLDVIQFANQAHLTGCLVLRRSDEQAELFYRKGGLIHARQGGITGLEVLVDIVDWGKGEFEFQTGVDAPDETIRMDLHRAVMHALKKRDERRQEEERARLEEQPVEPAPPSLQEQFQQMVAPLDFVLQAALFNGNGILACAHHQSARPEDLAPLCASLWTFIGSHPRGELRKAILDDPKGTVVVSLAVPGHWLLVIPVRGITLGAITVGMGKLLAQIGANLTIGNRKEETCRN